MQPFECTGLWSLPHFGATRVAGILRVSSNGRPQLSLFGSLPREPGLNLGDKPLTIWGTVDNSPSGNVVTLVDCIQIASTTSLASGEYQEYRASRAYFGAYLSDRTDSAFRQLRVGIEGLTEWAHSLSGFTGAPWSIELGKTAPLLEYTRRPPVTGTIPGGAIDIGMAFRAKGESDGYSFHEQAEIWISCESAASAEALNGKFAYPLQNLLTFVCDRAQEMQRISVLKQTEYDPQSNPEIRVIGPRVHPAEEQEKDQKRMHHWQMLFSVEDIGTDLPSFFTEWFRFSETFRDACNVYFGVIYGPPAYLDVKFMSIVQAFELYFARRSDGIAMGRDENQRRQKVLSALPADEATWLRSHFSVLPFPPLPEILRKLLEEQGDVVGPLLAGGQKEFVTSVIDTLNHVTGKESDKADSADQGVNLYWMTEKLRYLLKACFLREIGFSQKKIAAFFDRNAYYLHIRGLADQGRRAGQSPR
jgi:hypothetical protein